MGVNGEDYIDLDTAKGLIIDALTAFDEALGERAVSILHNDARTNILEITDPSIVDPQAVVDVQMYRPAGTTETGLAANDMFIADFQQKFNMSGYGDGGGPFTSQANDSEHGIVDLVYRGTPVSISWLAHELGHGIANDIQIENGRSASEFSPAEQEEQAYFVQKIVIDHLRNKFGLDDVGQTNLGEPSLCNEFSDRASQFAVAKDRYEEALAQDADIRSELVNRALDQRISTI